MRYAYQADGLRPPLDCTRGRRWKAERPATLGRVKAMARRRGLTRSREMLIYARSINPDQVQMLIGMTTQRSVSKSVLYLNSKDSHR